MNEFDIKAADWDNNPMHWDRSEAIAKEIISLIPLTTEMTAIEFGAGTGILSFILKDHLKEIVLMDNSSEMVKIMSEKINTTKTKNLAALDFDLEHSVYEGSKTDLVFTQMVLHHVHNIDDILKKFYNMLNPGGYLAIADLYLEDGSFHGEGFRGHNGFDIRILFDQLKVFGFRNISHRKCFVLNRKISDTETRQFDIFLLIAQK